MQDLQQDHHSTGQSIYLAALSELEKIQREIDFEKVTARSGSRQRAFQHTLLAGSVLLGSLLSAVAVHGVLAEPPRLLSTTEASAIHSLVDYVALRQAANDSWVRHALCAHFGVTAIDELAANHYDDAVFYLLKLAQN